MRKKLVQSKANFGFHLDGENSIDAKLLSKTISDMVDLTELAAKEKDPDVYLKMKVTAFENGSFEVDFSTVCEVAVQIGVSLVALAGFANTVVNVVKGALEIKKLLKGDKAKSITPDDRDNSKVKIENNDGVVISVDKASTIVINNFRADELASNLAAYVKDHNPNGGFSFTSEDGVLNCGPDDVEGMIRPLPDAREILSKRYTVMADLPIKKADLLGASSWEFRYNDRVITAAIKDIAFLNSVHRGASVQAGDYISASLEISVDLDEEMKPVGKEQFTVIHVNGGIKKDNNLKFDV